MHLLALISIGLALTGSTIGVPIPIPKDNDFPGNISSSGDEDILGDFHALYPEIMNLTSTTSRYHRNDPVPFKDLPYCYQKCIDANHNNGWPSLGDVRKLTIHQWCHSRWIPVQAWIHEHLQFCIGDACAYCRPECRDASSRWQREVCSNS
ncbi:hypothetical protein F4781DRAFT_376655 [Annulohypoxylon bovei var. microspora]|nr:hypothetical protein F4781DRAFT_376655 [Annulohypoxylon bovei var. microspora]